MDLEVWRLESSVNRAGFLKATEGAKTGRQASNNSIRAVKFIDINKQSLDTRVQDPPSLNLRERQGIIFTSYSTCTHTNKSETLWEEVDSGLCVQLRLLSKVKGLLWLTSQEEKGCDFPVINIHNTLSGWCWLNNELVQYIYVVKGHTKYIYLYNIALDILKKGDIHTTKWWTRVKATDKPCSFSLINVNGNSAGKSSKTVV